MLLYMHGVAAASQSYQVSSEYSINRASTEPSQSYEPTINSKTSVDVRRYMPLIEYTPHPRGIEENILLYNDRITLGKKRFDARQKRFERFLLRIVDENKDETKLDDELQAAAKGYKDKLKDKRRVYNSELEYAGTNRKEFENPLKSEAYKESVMKQVLEKRRRQAYASRFRKQYRGASEWEREAVIRAAAEAGFSKDDLTRRKFLPSAYERTENRVSNYEEASRDETIQQEMMIQPATLQDLDDFPQDWLSLEMPGHQNVS